MCNVQCAMSDGLRPYPLYGILREDGATMKNPTKKNRRGHQGKQRQSLPCNMIIKRVSASDIANC